MKIFRAARSSRRTSSFLAVGVTFRGGPRDLLHAYDQSDLWLFDAEFARDDFGPRRVGVSFSAHGGHRSLRSGARPWRPWSEPMHRGSGPQSPLAVGRRRTHVRAHIDRSEFSRGRAPTMMTSPTTASVTQRLVEVTRHPSFERHHNEKGRGSRAAYHGRRGSCRMR